MMYKVTFDFRINDFDSDGKWHNDYLDNNGEGFTYEEAEDLAQHLRGMSFPYQNDNVKIEEV